MAGWHVEGTHGDQSLCSSAISPHGIIQHRNSAARTPEIRAIIRWEPVLPNVNRVPIWAAPGNVARLLSRLFVVGVIAGIVVVPARSAGSQVLISQVYGGGGSGTAGPPYRNDYVELFNRSAAAVDLTGWSVQYGSATGTSWQVSALSGTIAAGGYLLVEEGANGSTNGATLTAPFLTGTLNMSAANGKVALVSSTTALTGANPAGTAIVDKVGYGTANGYETSAAPALTNTTALLRVDGGCTDTDNNGADFAVGTPAPRNSTSPTHSCGVPAADTLAFSVQPVGAIAGSPFGTQPVVTAQTAGGATDEAFTGSVTLSIKTGPAGAALSGTITTAAVAGVATFTNLSISKAAGGYVLTAAAPGVASADSAAFAVAPGAPSQLAFTVQPSSASSNVAISPAPSVGALDAFGNPTPSFSAPVNVQIGGGTAGATLLGTFTQSASGGVASFPDLAVDKTGAGYSLTASSAGLTPVVSSPFAITPPTALTGYTITDLGTLPSAEAGATAYRINNRGQVAGWSGHPFLWSNATLADLNSSLPSSVFAASPARGINDAGIVVGTFYPFTTVAQLSAGNFSAYCVPHAFEWSGGVFTDLTPAAVTPQQAVAVNGAGDVAILSSSSFVRKSDGTTVPLAGLTTGSALAPNDINDSGDVVGDAVTASWNTRAVWWHAGATADLGALPGDVNSSATAIAASGVIVGDSYGAVSTIANTSAVVWQGGAISALPPRNTGESCVALGLNAYGEIVGYVGSDTADGAGALLWDNGAVRDLQTLIPSNSGWRLSAARSVNDRGQIVGYGWHNNAPRAYLLTPGAVFGDANGDGLVTPADAMLVAAMAAGTAPASNVMYLDVAPSPSTAPRGFGDGKIDLLDAVRILRRAASLETQWP